MLRQIKNGHLKDLQFDFYSCIKTLEFLFSKLENEIRQQEHFILIFFFPYFSLTTSIITAFNY